VGGGVIGGWEKFPSFTVFFILTASLTIGAMKTTLI
jgi:hypothetical protein